MIWEKIQSRSQLFTLINGLLPFTLILGMGLLGLFLQIGYLFYGWVEILGLSTFVSLVPDVAEWYFFGISLVGAENTANITMSGLVLIGAVLIIFGYLRSFQTNLEGEINGRTLWLIGGILTFPLGILALISYRNTRPKERDLTLRERITGELRKNKLPYLLIVPALIFLFFTYIIPILRGLYITVFSYPEASKAFFPVKYAEDPLLWTLHALLGGFQRGEPTFIGIENYIELFSNSIRATQFQNALDNNIYFVIMFVPGVILVSLGLALLLNNKLLKGENAYTTIFYMPVITSVLVVSVIWLRIVFPADGLLTIILTTFAPIHDGFFAILNIITLGIVPANVVQESINWLSVAMIESVTIMSIWRSVGFDVLILLAGLKSIPSSLYEAAEIDGHGSWSKFKNITLPNLKGPLGVVVILELINGWQIFQEFYGLNIAQYGGDQSLAIYLIANYADPVNLTYASTVGYFIFGMTAFIGLLGRVEMKNLLKGFSLFILLAILFSVPSNRTNTLPKSLGFTLPWMTFDLLFLAIAFFFLIYYFINSIIKYRELEDDLRDLRMAGFFTLFVVPFYLFNGYNILTKSGFGSTPFYFPLPFIDTDPSLGFIGNFVGSMTIPSLFIGLILLIIAILMISAYYFVPFMKKRQMASFLFHNEDASGV
ncbi:MAG: carbohydrate ABC transporter permease [Candidatus Hodarchaeales archaeon]